MSTHYSGAPSSIESSQSFHSLSGDDYQRSPPQSNTTTNENGLIGGGGGGGGGLILPANSLARQESIYSLSGGDYQRYLEEPGQTSGSNEDEYMQNIWAMEARMEESQRQTKASAMNIVTGSGEGGCADDQAHSSIASENGGGGALMKYPSLVNQPSPSLSRTINRNTMEGMWRDHESTTLSFAPSGSGDGGVNIGNSTSTEVRHAERKTRENAQQVLFETAGVVACKRRQAQAEAHAHHQAQQQASDHSREHWLWVKQQQAQAQAQQAHLQADLFQQATARAQQARLQANLFQQATAREQQARLQADLFQQATARAQQASNQAQLFQGVGNGGPIPNIPNRGYTGMASCSAQQLGQMGKQFVLPLPAPSPALEGGVNGHNNVLSSSIPVGTYGVDGSMGGRTRGADGPVDEALTRRQRKMIKNRESAGRSRDRKQARTLELETEIAKLKEENERLKKENEEKSNDKESPDGKKKLLRTRSSPF